MVRVYFDDELFWRAFGWDKEDEYNRCRLRAASEGKDFIEVPYQDYADARRIAGEIRRRDELMYRTVARNNFGHKSETNGRIEDAVAAYEENIAEGYAATFSFDRLMVIYHKRRDYANEVRVINRALEVFNAANHKADVERWLRRREKACAKL